MVGISRSGPLRDKRGFTERNVKHLKDFDKIWYEWTVRVGQDVNEGVESRSGLPGGPRD